MATNRGKGSKSVILDQVARDLWEQKAAKPDDAAIPEYLWLGGPFDGRSVLDVQ
jgi:hypothetical protein